MGRQMYHRTVLNALILSILFIAGCSGLLNNSDNSNADLLSSHDFIQTKGEIDAIVSQIESKYPIRISYKKSLKWTWGIVGYTKLAVSDYAQLLKYLTIFQEEFNKYPPEFIRKSNLKWVVIGKNLSYLGQHRASIPDYRREILYYDIAQGSYDTCYQKSVIHHEFYHMIEEEFNGNVYYKDTDWAKLNSKDFKYGKGGKYFNSSISKKVFHPDPGFITDYSTSGLEEDKAEVYAGLFVEETSACLGDWIKEDEILRNKVNYMKDFLLQHCDEMTSDFWANLCTGECSSLDVSVVSSYEIQDLRFSAELPDNAAVELIAIVEGSGNSKKWWKPNGEIFDEAPFKIAEPETNIDDEVKQYRFFLCDKTNQSLWGLSGWELPEGNIYKIETPNFDGNGRVFLDVCVVTCGLDDDKTTCQLKKGVPLGKWTVEATYNPKTKVTSGPDRSIKFGKLYAKKGKLGSIEVSHNISESRKTAKQTVAVDHTGKIHLPMHFETVTTEHGQRTYSFFRDLNLAQVKEFHFKSCPYTWVTFENISLRPGQITDVQIKVGNN